MRYTLQDIIANAYMKFPKFLLSKEFAKLSSDAKVLYTVMLDRHTLSLKNRWHDENGDVYIHYSREQMQTDVSKSDKTVKKAVDELKAASLVEDVRQGLNRPNKIYLLMPQFTPGNIGDVNFEENYEQNTPADDLQAHENQGRGKNPTPDAKNLRFGTRKYSDSVHGDIPTQNAEKFRPNKTNNNKTDKSNNVSLKSPCPVTSVNQENQKKTGRDRPTKKIQSPPKDKKHIAAQTRALHHSAEAADELEKRIKANIEYDEYIRTHPFGGELLDNFVNVILDTIMSMDDTIKIDGQKKPLSAVRNIFLKLNCRDVEHAINQFKNVAAPVKRKANYIRTILYNTKLEGDAHYENQYRSQKYA